MGAKSTWKVGATSFCGLLIIENGGRHPRCLLPARQPASRDQTITMTSAAKATCHFPVLFSRPALTYPAFRSDLDAVLDRRHDLGHRIIHGDAVALLAAAVAERDRSGGHVVIAGEQ